MIWILNGSINAFLQEAIQLLPLADYTLLKLAPKASECWDSKTFTLPGSIRYFFCEDSRTTKRVLNTFTSGAGSGFFFARNSMWRINIRAASCPIS